MRQIGGIINRNVLGATLVVAAAIILWFARPGAHPEQCTGPAAQLAIELQEGYAASGRVVDARGQAIPGAEISMAVAVAGVDAVRGVSAIAPTAAR